MATRSNSLEILRVVSMLLVVLAHVVSWGTTVCPSDSGNVTFSNGGINSLFYIILQTLAALGVICFVFITSYFICESNVLKFNRILKVWSQTAFYSVLMAVVSSFFINIPKKQIFVAILPLFSDQYWFVTKYLGLVILAPVLSYAVNFLSQKGFIYVLATLSLITMTITFGVPYGNVIFGGNFSIGSFILVFFIASYLKRFGAPGWLSHNCGKIFIFSILFQVAGGLASNLFHDGTKAIYGGFSVGYNAFSIIPATALFIWFKEKNFANNWLTRYTVALAPYSFAVYLIHDNQYFREILWTKIFHLPEFWNAPGWTLLAITIPFAIFLVCSGVDFFRNILFRIAGFERLIEKVRRKNVPLS